MRYFIFLFILILFVKLMFYLVGINDSDLYCIIEIGDILFKFRFFVFFWFFFKLLVILRLICFCYLDIVIKFNFFNIKFN